MSARLPVARRPPSRGSSRCRPLFLLFLLLRSDWGTRSGGGACLSRRSCCPGGAPNSGNSRNSRATPATARSEPPNGAVPGPTGAKRRDRAACLRDTVRGRPAGYTSTSTTVLPEPRAAPAAIVRRLNAATLKAMADDLVLLLDAQGFVLARPRTLEETASQTREHSARWAEVIRAAGIRL